MRTRGDIEEEIQEILENQGILLQEIDWNQENRAWENYARFVQEIQEFQELQEFQETQETKETKEIQERKLSITISTFNVAAKYLL